MPIRKASALVMLAVKNQAEAHQKAMQQILDAALFDDPTLEGGRLDASSGAWLLPELAKVNDPAP